MCSMTRIARLRVGPRVGARSDRPLGCARRARQPGVRGRSSQENREEKEKRRRRRRKGQSCRSPPRREGADTCSPGTMCWIGSLYISLPFGLAKAPLPYEGAATRSTCSKQNATGDQLQRPPPPPPCLLLGLFFRQTLSLAGEESVCVCVGGGGGGSINC